jgi:hypothetical protein
VCYVQLFAEKYNRTATKCRSDESENITVFVRFLRNEKPQFFCFVDVASRYVMETNLMHYLSSVCFVSHCLRISGIFLAHHQDVYCIQGVPGEMDKTSGECFLC